MESFKKLFDEFMNAPWRVEEFPLTRLSVCQGEWNGVLSPLYTWKFVFHLFTLFTVSIIVVYVFVLSSFASLWITRWGVSYRITYTSATEVQVIENQRVSVADALKPICRICHGFVADGHCLLQMVCHRNPLEHSFIWACCSVAEVIGNSLVCRWIQKILHSIEGWTGWRVREWSNMYMCIRALV